MSLFLAIIAAAAGTYLLRASLVALPDRHATPAWLSARLPLLGPAILAAIITASLVGTGGAVHRPQPVEVAAVAAGALAVRRTGSVGAALAVGLPIYWVGTALGLA